jgi:beta-galactosidase
MKKVPYNFDWKFTEGMGHFFIGAGDMKTVDLPHDYIVNKPRTPHSPGGASTGFFPGGQGTYTRDFNMPKEWRGKTVLLDIDGAYMNSEVFLNGDKLLHHPYGYTAYQVDLSARLRDGLSNNLRITTQCFQPSTRWYSGGGLYREACLWIGGKCYIHPWDIFVTTPEVSTENAVVHAAIEVTNTLSEVCEGELNVYAVSKTGETVAEAHCKAVLQPEGKMPFAIDLNVMSPLLWNMDDTHLYTLRVVLRIDGQEADISEVAFGIRKIEIDSKHGLRLNGRKLKLRGGCIHHDNSLLGACAFPRAEERKVQILKDSGYNAIRTAHNPPSKALLDACDRIGMLVLDESFDMWRTQKNPLDYHLYFESWWQHDTRAMVLRDRNHPCIYCWSIGNEVQELLGISDGAYWTKVQADYVRSLDPTRPVSASANGFTAAVPGKPPVRHDMKKEMQGKPRMGLPVDGEDIWGEQTQSAAESLDIFGYNYLYGRYDYDRVKFPERVIHATETHSFHTYDYWKAMLENDQVIGDFIWTAFDNLGEAGAGRVIYDLDSPMRGLMGDYPWLSCWQGDHDLSGDRRPQSYYRKIMWGLNDGIHMFTTHPSMTCKPFYGMGWHWEDVKQNWTFELEYIGKPVKVQAYADCDDVEFVLNGKIMGRVKPEEFKAVIEVPYEPGILEAVAWKDGKKAAYDRLQTASKAARIVLNADRSIICADGMDLCFISVVIVDEAGVPVVADSMEISVKVEGVGTLAGLGSGNPRTEESYGTGKRYTFDGRALVCVRAGRTAGDISVEVAAEGLEMGAVKICCE